VWLLDIGLLELRLGRDAELPVWCEREQQAPPECGLVLVGVAFLVLFEDPPLELGAAFRDDVRPVAPAKVCPTGVGGRIAEAQCEESCGEANHGSSIHRL
jgi:hypothetical protein